MLNWIWSRWPSSDRRVSMAPALRPWRRAITSIASPASYSCSRCASSSALQLRPAQDAVQRPDDLGAVIDALVRQRPARHGVDTVCKTAKQLGCALDLHMLTFSDVFFYYSTKNAVLQALFRQNCPQPEEFRAQFISSI